MSCDIIELESQESAGLAVSLNLGFFGFKMGASFDASKESNRNYAALNFMQTYFTIDSTRPINPSLAFASSVTSKDIEKEFSDGTVPVYSSVVYGRMCTVLIETDKEISQLKAAFNTSYKNNFDLQADIEAFWENSNTSMSYYMYGGTSEQIEAIQSTNINDFITKLTSLPVEAPLPIGYRFYYLDDGTAAKIAKSSEYITKKLVPVKVNDFSFSMNKLGSGESDVKEIQSGDILSPTIVISPSQARVYKITYSINNCKDFEGKVFATIDSETGRLAVLSNAIVGESIKVELKISQIIDGKTVNVIRDHYLKVIPIPVKNIIIEPNDNRSTVYIGERIEFNGIVQPENASNKLLKWEVISGHATFKDNSRGILTIYADAPPNEIIKVRARTSNGTISNEIILTALAPEILKLENLLLTSQLDNNYIFPGDSLFLNVSPVPLDFIFSYTDPTFIIESGNDNAMIKNGTLYVFETAKVGSEISVTANFGDIKSAPLNLSIAASATITDDSIGLGVLLDLSPVIINVNITILDTLNTAIGRVTTLNGNYLSLTPYGNNYSGVETIKIQYTMVDRSIATQTLTTHSLYGGGMGTAHEPFQIHNNRQYLNIYRNNNLYFTLTNDIYIDSKDIVQPIEVFSGSLDGKNYAINFVKEIYFSLLADKDISLGSFAKINDGEIKNIKYKNLIYKSDNNYHEGTFLAKVGGIVGTNNGIMDKITIEGGSFKCDRNHSAFGSICGYNKGTVSNCAVNATLYTTGDGGGIVGVADNGIVENCVFDGQIDMYVANDNGGQTLRSWGGIVGFATNSSSIKNCKTQALAINYHGENSIYHRVFIWHGSCNLRIKVGIICGHLDDTLGVVDFKNNTYNSKNSPLKINKVGGDFHYGSHEKAFLFAGKNGLVGRWTD